MPAKSKRERIVEEANSLDSILESIQDTSTEVNELGKKIISDQPPKTYTDWKTIQDECELEARKLVNDMTEYYLKEEFANTFFIRNKINNDTLVLSKILFQIKSNEWSCIKMLEQIEHGDFYPRNFEVLTLLQRAQMEIAKHHIQIQVVLENSYRNLGDEYMLKAKQDNNLTSLEIHPNNLPTGHRALLNHIKDISAEHI